MATSGSCFEVFEARKLSGAEISELYQAVIDDFAQNPGRWKAAAAQEIPSAIDLLDPAEHQSSATLILSTERSTVDVGAVSERYKTVFQAADNATPARPPLACRQAVR